MKFIEKQRKIERIIETFNDSTGSIATQLKSEHAITSSQENMSALKNMENTNRLLRIGIVGRVKSGKSSLLNALLFDGEEMLPKAATPMTAALTILSYAEDFSAEAHLFTENDIETIKNNAIKYEEEKNRIIKDKTEEFTNQKKHSGKKPQLSKEDKEKISKMATRKAYEELKKNMILTAAYEHNKLLTQATISIGQLDNENIITGKNVTELNQKLLDYVSAHGKYTPFTKSVHVKFPNNVLKDLEIVDTPGVNDPVQSREQRTRELLKECDAIFIVSPAGQFMTNEDTELMDRITTKEGLSELFVVASQVDTQLMGSVKRDSNGVLDTALYIVASQLSEQLHSILINLKQTHPEIGTVYDQLIQHSSEKLIHSAGVATSMVHFWDNRKRWDPNMKKVWENLTKHYPDYFSNRDSKLSIANLNKLANIDGVNHIISLVRKKKDDILAKRKKEFIAAKEKAVSNYLASIIEEVEKRLDEIKSTSLSDLIKTQNELKRIQEKASILLDEEYDSAVLDLKTNLTNELFGTLRNYIEGVQSDIANAEASETRSYEHYKGLGFFFYRFFTGTRYETRYRTITTVRAGAVKSSLEDFTLGIETAIYLKSDKIIMGWRKEAPRRLLGPVRKVVDDDYLEAYKIIKAFTHIFNNINYPELEYSGSLPVGLNKSGTLEDSEAETFISEAEDYVSSLKRRVTKDINNFLHLLVEKLHNINLSKEFFSDLENELSRLKEQIETKEMSIDTFNRVLKSLQEVL